MPRPTLPIARRHRTRAFVTVAVAASALLATSARPAVAGPELPPDDRVAIELVAGRLGLDPAGLVLVSSAETVFDGLGLAVRSAKVMDAEGGLHAVSFDAAGNEVDVDALGAEADIVRRKELGSIDPALAAALGAQPGERRPVLIWLREPSLDLAPRPDAAGEPLKSDEVDRAYSLVDARRAEAVAPLLDAVLGDVLRLDGRATGLTPAPAITATLDDDQVRSLASDPRIDTIYDAPAAAEELAIAEQTTGVDRVHGTGLDGTGVRVGVVEVGGRSEQNSLLLRPITQHPANVCAAPTAHSTNVTSVIVGRRINFFGQIVGTNGVANGAEVFVGGSCNAVAAELQTAATRASDWGARVLNMSWGIDQNGVVGGEERFYDDIVHNRWRTITKSAGNRNCAVTGTPDADVTSPGLAYNLVTVGGLDDAGTAAWSDDAMYACSSFVDPTSRNGDREKPELVAPAAAIEMVDPGVADLRVDSGTSFAAPHVAGATALLIQKNGRLAIWPEIVRAVLMASAVHNIEGASRLSDQDGAGGLAADRAAGIVENPDAWDGVRFECSTPRTLDLTTRSVGRRTRHRVAISWTTDPSFADYAVRPSADIDLQVVDALGRVVASSASFDNTTEIVEFDAVSAGTFTVRAVNFRCDRPTFLGWAWDTSSLLRRPGR